MSPSRVMDFDVRSMYIRIYIYVFLSSTVRSFQAVKRREIPVMLETRTWTRSLCVVRYQLEFLSTDNSCQSCRTIGDNGKEIIHMYVHAKECLWT